ncbi:MAG TPA: DUF2017 family protein [Acidimicrobiia bacterium]|nr:DUF2017 family protein [Acidimicrobiia bacterium]
MRVELEGQEIALLAGLPRQLEDVIAAVDGPVHARLFPAAYLDPTEDEAEREWQRLMHGELLRGKLAAVGAFRDTLDHAAPTARDRVELVLAPDEVDTWLAVLNDVRLALGVTFEVTEDLEIEAISTDDPRAPGLHLYAYLTWVQDALIRALGT